MGHFTKEDGSLYNARTDTLKDIRSSKGIKTMQQKMLDDKPDKVAENVIQEEMNNNVSRRI